MKPRAIIIDLDNTLCKNRKQATSDMKHWKDYWPLYKHIPEDEPQRIGVCKYWTEYILKVIST